MRVLTDATCIRVLCGEKLLIGIGNQLLLVYRSSNGSTLRRIAPLPRLVDKIHGIEACVMKEEQWLVIVHAGRATYSIILDCQSHTFSECALLVIPEEIDLQPVPFIRRRLNDWISRISLLSSTELCIVTAHGVAALLKRGDSNRCLQWDVVDKSPCEDGSTLYCSTITGQQWENVIILSGTALGLLLIWSVDGPNRGKVLTSVSAHNGVIFSISCNFNIGLLTTTSDDRSVKFWNVKLSGNKDSCSRAIELREERYCFAHTARVFQCRIINGEHRTLVASIGEDSHLCLWTVDGDLVLKKRLDEGPTLWSMDYDPTSATIFVTASNGNLHKYCIRHAIDDGDDLCKHKNALTDISPNLQRNEHLAKVKFLNNGYMVAITNHNQVMILDSSGTIVQQLERLDDFKCSIIEIGATYLYLAGGCCVKIYKIGNDQPTHLVGSENVTFQKSFENEAGFDVKESSIRSLNYCTRSKTVAVCDSQGRCVVFDETLADIVSCHTIPNSPERWLTAFVVLNESLLLMADRSGHLYLFDKLHVEPAFKLTNVHGKLGITAIIVEENCLPLTDVYNLRTTGHDGRICDLAVNCSTRTLELLTFSKSVIGWIDRKLVVRGSKTFYLGFNDSHFLVVDDANETFVQFDCGGGHRCWDFFYEPSAAIFTFVFIQHKKLKKVHFTPRNNVGSELTLSRFNWHTRACNVLQVAMYGNSYLLLSGGEDNILRINVLDNGQILEAPRKHLFSHISSVKTILVKRLENDALLMISAGGRAQICLTSIDLDSFRIKQEYEYMLLATDSERSRWKTNRRSTFDPETKFMCAAFLTNDRIVFGCSDGFVRIFQLSTTDGQFSVSLTGETFYGRCILKMISIDIDEKSIFITMATDGYLCFWDASCPTEPIFRHRHHTSGVNAVDVKQIGAGKLVFVTGGDDQSVTISLLEMKKSNEKLQVRVLKHLSEQYMHTAQVTGLKLLDNDKMISVGVDQRLFVSSFSSYDKLVVESTINTCIADVKGVSFIEEDNEAIVYGCGIEIIQLQGTLMNSKMT
ncbi:tRNA (34-2'-O)-methyltransferase regulator WDR6 [Anopheles gambiae]|uniref:tRNA (34-2'-O)-methyltransferase regulator WDR6 n=1 Tax=Anopheles gambiae TaxID=7165 RepID=UPI002AC9A90A|nr:tRNA (34-2'-O)-methyltransferase regulator WDR6 [Anopheles gambiae]